MKNEPVIISLALVAMLFALQGCVTGDLCDSPEARGGYSRGQLLRLRVPAVVYEFDKVNHPAETGWHADALEDMQPDNPASRADWERRNAGKIIAILPVGTVLRITRIDYAYSIDDAAIVPRAIITEGELRREVVGIVGLSISVRRERGAYPDTHAPNPKYLEVVNPPN